VTPVSEDIATLVEAWPVPTVAAAVTSPTATVAVAGDSDWVVPVASISKLLAGYVAMVAVEEGTIALDGAAGRPGATFRHLLSHAAGYGFDGTAPVAAVGVRRIYSNTGIEVAADELARRAGMPYRQYLADGVLRPLGMGGTVLSGSPAHGVASNVGDLARFARELMRPTLISAGTRDEMVSVQFPQLAGVVPGVGRFDPNPWGLGPEIKGGKTGHWMGAATSDRTYGHFGGTGTFLWVDPGTDLAVVALTNRQFGPWALRWWPLFCDQVVTSFT